jgi:CheY-like chemotaxis protein
VTHLPDNTEPALGHILVAEDDVVAQMVIKKIIEQTGYTMDLVADGREALSALESKHYDLILMDCLMPRMNGFEATREIRNSDSPHINSGIPIIAMTGLTAEDDKQRCLDAGMYEVISKPFDLADLVPVLRHCMAKLEEVVSVLDADEEAHDQTWDDTFLDDVIDKFLTEVPRVTSELQEAINQGDPEKLRNIAHRFRGATDILKVAGLSARSQALEQAAETGQTQLAITHATELIDEMQKLMRMLAE